MICNEFLTNNCTPSCTKNHKCIKSYDNRKYITCEEKRKKYILENVRSVNIANYHIDGGVVQNDDEKKCDFLIYVEDDKNIILVELKGTEFSTALKQLYNTVNLFSQQFNGNKIYARIVGKEVPKIANSPDAVKLIKLLKKHGGNLKSNSDILSEKETQLA